MFIKIKLLSFLLIKIFYARFYMQIIQAGTTGNYYYLIVMRCRVCN